MGLHQELLVAYSQYVAQDCSRPHPHEDALRAALLGRQQLGIDPSNVPSEASNGH